MEATAQARRLAASPLVIGTAAALSVACFARFGLTGRAVVNAGLCSVLVVLSAVDLERRVIPNRIVLPAGALVLLANIAVAPGQALEWVLAALSAMLFFLVLALVNPSGLGMGDVKLAFLLGAGLGRDVAVALVIASLAAFAVAVWIIARRGLAGRKESFPLGPCLALGGVLALFLG